MGWVYRLKISQSYRQRHLLITARLKKYSLASQCEVVQATTRESASCYPTLQNSNEALKVFYDLIPSTYPLTQMPCTFKFLTSSFCDPYLVELLSSGDQFCRGRNSECCYRDRVTPSTHPCLFCSLLWHQALRRAFGIELFEDYI